MNFTLRSRSAEQTQAIAGSLGACLKGNEILLLSGELGCGKTQFAKGIAAALAIPPTEVVSPTFALLIPYVGKFHLFHFDLYRLAENARFFSDALDEVVGQGIILVEWAQYLPAAYFQLPTAIDIRFVICGNNCRDLLLKTRLRHLPHSFTDASAGTKQGKT